MNALEVEISGKRWEVREGEVWVVTGPVASGKTWLARQLVRLAPDDVALVTVDAQAGQAGTDWAEARYHASIEYDFHTVKEALSYEAVNAINPFEVRPREASKRRAFVETRAWLEEALELKPLYPHWTVQLSNGEQRRLMLARAILKRTPLLVLDDPFAGLDPRMQGRLRDLLSELAKRGWTLVVMVRNEDEIPPCATHRLRLKARKIVAQGAFRAEGVSEAEDLTFPPNPKSLSTPVVLSVRGLSLEVGARVLFGGLDWEVHEGERWVVVGPNGCGKSTLLSLITGDNPMAYACDVERFGKKPGPGVPLWSLRSRMASVSPEAQAFLDGTQTVEAAAFSGIFDKEGRRKRPTPHQRKKGLALLTALGLHEKLREPLGTLSTGLVRLVLVVRALASEPDLLLLDELCMNLEAPERKKLLRLLDRLFKATAGLTVVCIAHRKDHIPPHFDYVLRLGVPEEVQGKRKARRKG